MSGWDIVAGVVSSAVSVLGISTTMKAGEAAAVQLEIKKKMEKMLIKTFYAPAKIRERDAVKAAFDSEVETIATETKASIKGIAVQLDSSMSGRFSTSVQETIESENQKWGSGFIEDKGSVGQFRILDGK